MVLYGLAVVLSGDMEIVCAVHNKMDTATKSSRKETPNEKKDILY